MRPAELQEHAQHWRSLLSRFQYELLQLLEQLPVFHDFLLQGDNGDNNEEQLVGCTTKTLKDVLEQIKGAFRSLHRKCRLSMHGGAWKMQRMSHA
jgi:hypothetical protein